jgi:hypothetical protein
VVIKFICSMFLNTSNCMRTFGNRLAAYAGYENNNM